MQKLVAFFSGKLRRLLGDSTTAKKTGFKLLLHGFPGGPEGFELIVRFCYNGGKIVILPSNVVLLHAAARFLEISENQTEKYLQTIHSWTWFELLDCLKQFQKLVHFTNSSTYVAGEILEALVEKISMPNVSSPFSYFFGSDNSMVSSSSSSSISRSSNFRRFNWLRDLEFLNVGMFEKVTSAMISRKLEDRLVCSFLAHYRKVKFVKFASLLERDEKCKIVEILVTSLSSLDGGSSGFPFRGLCDVLRLCFVLKMERFWVKKVERMIGCRLDEATLDDLLVRARRPTNKRVSCAFDVSLVSRLLRVFVGQNGKKIFARGCLTKVGELVDSYLAEVAPDRELKPCTFLGLALCLPDSSRETHDKIFDALDMYFKVHEFVSEEEKMRMCSVLNYEKLSSKSLVQISQNAAFPASAIAAAVCQLKSKLENQSNDLKNLELRSHSSSSFSIDVQEIAPHGLWTRKECKKSQKKLSGCCYK
ncbi:phototropic-responsive NPH3 family protein [Striga asiatica]|uniref:Phototropic-responsive NPH3 family protein n=1 Tax=Striga asiatica TaxID=4170 RepID=A0A5A7Q9S4_STRAF|nr:phototropic-responsive NPH3 family protein [Striga asiatica]